MKKLLYYILITFISIPLVYLIIYSFFNLNEWPSLTIKNLRLDGIKYFFDYQYYDTLLYSIIISTIASLSSILLVLPCIRYLANHNVKYKNIIKMIFILPILVPITSISIGVYYYFLVLGLAGTSLGIIIIHIFCVIPYTFIILERSYQRKNIKLYKIAKQLKASNQSAFINVELPSIINAIILSFSLGFVISFSQYFTSFLIGSGKIKTYAMELFPYIMANDRHYLSIFNLFFIISILITISIFIFIIRVYYQKHKHYKIDNEG